LDDAGLTIDAANRDRIGMILGTAVGATDVAARFGETLFTEGPKFVSPLLVPNTVMNAPAGHNAIELGFRGVNSTVNHREASAETAIAYAASEIALGRADVIFTGGADILSPFFFEILTRFRSLSPADEGNEAARPFDVDRNGYVAGEGAGVLCLEALDHADARGAAYCCEIAGWGMSAAPAPPTDWPSDPQGPLLAMQRALRHAGISAADVDCVSASANGGRKLDRLEADALKEIFGEGGDRPLVTSLKSAVGESFSSGGVRAAAMALSMMHGAAPPTLGLETPIRRLPFVQGETRETGIACGMVNGFSSGGTFVSLILRAVA
jgi:3-oxoacyl-[acyl-carrier-protein] synthase II